MPLPASNTPWPPVQYRRELAEVAAHAAWYEGNRAQLASIYGRTNHTDDRPSSRRFFWSQQRDITRRDNRLHVPLPADIATTSADLLFSEPPQFEIPDAGKKDSATGTQTRLDEIVEQGGIVNRLLEAAEVASALGGVYLKVDWDETVARRPFLAAVHADAAVPEFRWGQLVAVTFWRVVHDTGSHVLRLLERHERGRIELGVYQGTKENLGQPIPLTDRDVPDHVKALAEGLSEDGVSKETGIPTLTAGYVPNMRPNRRYRGSDLGRSDYQSVEDLFDALDETMTSWMRDIRLGRGRLVVPKGYLETLPAGEGALFDAEREVFTELNAPPTGVPGGLTLSQFQIRVDEHSRTAQELTAKAVGIAGYSAQSFGLTGDVAATATEVTARERKSFITRDKKSRYFAPVLADMLETMLAMDRSLFTAGLEVVRPRVVFGDSVSEDPQRTATTIEILNRAQAISTDTKVRLAHPDWDEEAVKVEVAKILGQNALADPAAPPPGAVA